MSRRRRRRRPSLSAYLTGLLALFLLVIAGVGSYERARNLDHAEHDAQDRVGFAASLAARDAESALVESLEAVGGLAANPGLRPLFDAPVPAGCTLSFTGAGPFPDGHIDVIDAQGRVLCSSRGLPADAEYQGAEFLDATESVIAGPVEDPASGEQALVVVAPIEGLGVVATFLDVAPVETRLADTFAGTTGTQFALFDEDGQSVTGAASADGGGLIVAAEPVPSLGWTLRAAVDRSDALADASALNRSLLIALLLAFAVLIAAVYVLYRGLARPIERLSQAVRAGVDDPSAPIPSSGPAEVVALADELTDLRRSVAQELAGRRDAEARYRRLFAANPLPMWVYDADTLQFLDVNDAAIASYGYTRDEFLGMTLQDIRSEEDVPALLASTAAQGPRDRSGPWRHVVKGGRRIEVEITSHEVDFGGRRARFVMAEDVTQRERSQRLQQRTQRMESLGQLAGGIAHDFNNLLAVVLGYTDLAHGTVSAAAADDPERWTGLLADLDQVSGAGRRAAALTQQLLGFARGDGVELELVDLNDVISSLEGVLRHTVGQAIVLDVSLAAELPSVRANPGQVEQVVVNLAVNARDAMPDGGRLLVETIALHLDEDAQRLSSHPQLPSGPYVRLRVTDTGEGMAPDQRDSAFEPFFTTKARGSGTGLGLATVFDIVDRAGGAIHLYSELELGTTVTILLPAADGPAAPVSEPVGGAVSTAASSTILVVDDQVEVLAAVERILARQGHRVITASDGPQALERAAAEPTLDLLVTDIVMPDMPGNELADRLREARPGLPVVFMSGYAPSVLRADGRLPTDALVVDKPFSTQALLDAVNGALGRPLVP